MKCTEIHELLPDLAAGFASAPPGINDHLRSCTECASKLKEFRKTMALLDEWQAPEPSPYFDTRLRARLREEAAKAPSSWFAWLRRPVLAASFALIVIAGVTAYQLRIVEKKPPVQMASAEPGTAVSDLQVLDKNQDLLADSDSDTASDLLDDLQVQQDVTANP